MSAQGAGKLASGLRLGGQIKQCEQALISEKQRVLRPFELTVPQYAAMLALSETPRLSGARLARRCGVSAQAMNGVVALLDERGLISRSRSEVHAKVLVIELTSEGRALLRRADRAAVAVERRLMESFSEAQLTVFREFLDTAIEALSGARPERPWSASDFD
ncbi:MarR family winged helix-turn-helix transcriptional regulator [Streptacidiphilus sp. P02-A3a]|uniref:MarR family winged helix-turn-helix transcriptional regulator n=1 Tax=Streptacidiphilus sp. P02-A3a TaxID=2704468 RepID=UPI0015F9CCD8|nr:MarR family transcriptional regulator [Streptacidiphilus sp. P02-A3a]QMU72549.1 MarR family transcriptional regulator [Streptacidiphilus sp. P02-A3a]